MNEDYEDWLCDNEYEKMVEFLEIRGITNEFQSWAFLEFCSEEEALEDAHHDRMMEDRREEQRQ